MIKAKGSPPHKSSKCRKQEHNHLLSPYWRFHVYNRKGQPFSSNG